MPTMPPDQTHLMTHVNQLIWNGEAETLGQLVADVEYDYTLSNPQADCTVIGVLQILQKIGVKNVTLSDALMKRLSCGENVRSLKMGETKVEKPVGPEEDTKTTVRVP